MFLNNFFSGFKQYYFKIFFNQLENNRSPIKVFPLIPNYLLPSTVVPN